MRTGPCSQYQGQVPQCIAFCIRRAYLRPSRGLSSLLYQRKAVLRCPRHVGSLFLQKTKRPFDGASDLSWTQVTEHARNRA